MSARLILPIPRPDSAHLSNSQQTISQCVILLFYFQHSVVVFDAWKVDFFEQVASKVGFSVLTREESPCM